MLKRYFLAFAVLLLTSCAAIKTVKLMKRGKIKQEKFKVEVPFEMRMGLVILKVNVNGVDADFILDTGAPNLISKELAQKLNLLSSVNRKAGDSQGKSNKLGFTSVANMNIGGIDFEETGAAIADLNASVDLACFKAEGLIGANLMRKAVWQIDYEKRIITITNDRSLLDIPASADKIKFKQMVTGTPIADLQLNGHTEKDVTIDLGFTGDFHLSMEVFNKIKKTSSPQTTFSYGHGSSGLFGKGAIDTTRYALISDVGLGSVKLNNVPVSFGKATARTVGTLFFKNYRLVFDWATSELLLINVKPYNETKSMKYRFGKIHKDNQVFVGLVYGGIDNSLKLGDQILEINGIDYRNCDPKICWCDAMEKFNNTNTLSVLVLRDGKELRFKIDKELLFKTN